MEVVESMHTGDDARIANLEEWQHQLKGLKWSHGDPAEAWRHVLETQEADAEPGDIGELQTVANALAGHIAQDLPWTQAGWREYVLRAMEWTDGYFVKDRNAVLNSPDVIFPHPGTEVRLGPLTAKPVTSSHELARAGAEMRNSLAYWVEACAEGKSWIYTIHRDGNKKIEAAMEISKLGAEWKVSQVEGLNFRRPTAQQRAIARRAADLLNA